MNNHRIKEAIRKAKRNIKIAQKKKDIYLETYWRGVSDGISAKIGLKKIKHVPKREKTLPRPKKKEPT